MSPPPHRAAALQAPAGHEPMPDTPDAKGTGKRAAKPPSAQRERILAAAMACFARDGFHGASMQKICAEAGMSPGALYRYFPSKESIIAAIVEGERAQRLSLFDAVARAPSILTALTDCMRLMLQEGALPTAQLGPEIMAEAIRNAGLRAAIEPCEAETRGDLREALEKATAQGEVDPGLDLDSVVMMLQIIGDGMILHHQLHPEWRLPDHLPAFQTLVQRMLAPPRPSTPE